jgi:long-subunit fatty acid transport protein
MSELALEIVNYGLSAAYRLNDSVSLGLGLSYFDFELASETHRFLRANRTDDLQVDVLTGNFYGPADFRPENIANIQTQDGDDQAVAAEAGVLWKIDDRWSVGGVFRQGPEFDFRAVFIDGPASDRPGQVDPLLGGEGTYHVPDVWGLGTAFRATDSMLFTFDWDYVRYSELAEDVVNLLRAALVNPGRFVMDDVHELHLGFEYQGLSARLPWSVRLGAWHDPDHRLRYEGPAENLRVRFRAGEDELHWSAGVGLVVARFQLDLAADVSEWTTTLSVSGVARF